MESVRIDRWLWAARMFKTRSLATAACQAGHVKVNGASVKPARAIRRGDRVHAVTPGGERILDVVELAERRGSAAVARTLYDDQTPPPPPKQERPSPVAPRERGMGRPSKRDRRQMQRLRGRDD